MKDVADFIKDVGFPVFVSLYLLWMWRTTIKENTGVMKQVKGFLERLNGRLDRIIMADTKVIRQNKEE